jgi:hypothetical protein
MRVYMSHTQSAPGYTAGTSNSITG